MTQLLLSLWSLSQPLHHHATPGWSNHSFLCFIIDLCSESTPELAFATVSWPPQLYSEPLEEKDCTLSKLRVREINSTSLENGENSGLIKSKSWFEVVLNNKVCRVGDLNIWKIRGCHTRDLEQQVSGNSSKETDGMKLRLWEDKKVAGWQIQVETRKLVLNGEKTMWKWFNDEMK